MVAISDSKHPLWSLLRYVAALGALTVILWHNASNFDWTEIRSVLEMVAVVVGFEGGRKALAKLRH